MIRSAFDATAIAVLFSQEETKHEFANLMNQWFEQLPKRSEQQIKDRFFPEHPMKLTRKALAFQYIIRTMAKAKPSEQAAEEEPWSVLKALADLPPETLDSQIQDCKPKFRQPKDGRKWLWHLSLSPVAASDIRSSLAILLSKNAQFKMWNSFQLSRRSPSWRRTCGASCGSSRSDVVSLCMHTG